MTSTTGGGGTVGYSGDEGDNADRKRVHDNGMDHSPRSYNRTDDRRVKRKISYDDKEDEMEHDNENGESYGQKNDNGEDDGEEKNDNEDDGEKDDNEDDGEEDDNEDDGEKDDNEDDGEKGDNKHDGGEKDDNTDGEKNINENVEKFEWGHLVYLADNPETFGVIANSEKVQATLFTQTGKFVTEKSHLIHNVVEKMPETAVDSRGNSLQRLAHVTVVDEVDVPLRQWQIRHIYKNYAFLYNVAHILNGGFIVCKTNQLELDDEWSNANREVAHDEDPGNNGNASPGLASPAHSGSIVGDDDCDDDGASNAASNHCSSRPPDDLPGNMSPLSSVCRENAKATRPPKPQRHDHRQQDNFPKDTFVTDNPETGLHQARFRILPYSRELTQKNNPASTDELATLIKRGGGLVVKARDREDAHSPRNRDVIKILDVDYVRANIKETQDMLLPYDCFSSLFILNQIYQRSNTSDGTGKRDADLSLFRIGPSAHVSHNPTGIFQGVFTWNDFQLIPPERRLPAIRVKDFALLHFPELLTGTNNPTTSGPSVKTRRAYTRQDSQTLLNRVCEVNGHDRIHGNSLYTEIAGRFGIDRSCRSLREHFEKKILPKILTGDGRYTIQPEDAAQFRALWQDKRTRKRSVNSKTSRKKAP